MELSSQKLGEALERECYDMDQVNLWNTYVIWNNIIFANFYKSKNAELRPV